MIPRSFFDQSQQPSQQHHSLSSPEIEASTFKPEHRSILKKAQAAQRVNYDVDEILDEESSQKSVTSSVSAESITDAAEVAAVSVRLKGTDWLKDVAEEVSMNQNVVVAPGVSGGITGTEWLREVSEVAEEGGMNQTVAAVGNGELAETSMVGAEAKRRRMKFVK